MPKQQPGTSLQLYRIDWRIMVISRALHIHICRIEHNALDQIMRRLDNGKYHAD